MIVIGSGISGSMAATILAHKGHSVLIIDGAAHPKFAIGESTVPLTSQTFEHLAAQTGIPELLTLARGPQGIREKIGTTCGIKRAFCFLYHREGEENRPEENNLFGNVWRDENHLYRQDVDTYIFRAALRYGADALENTRVSSVELDDDGVTVSTVKGQRFRARYLIDGSGPRSPFIKQHELAERPTSLRTNTRTIFTHMTDVKSYDDCVDNPFSQPWSTGTNHHVFDGGWFWVIAFDNWEGATNKVASVGLTLDADRYPPRDDVSPEEEFAEFVGKYPSIARQFEDARAVRPWIRAPKIQHSSRQCVGDRYCLMAHSYGFVDPLYSIGLIMTVTAVSKLVDPLCKALETDEFAREDFLDVEKAMVRRLRYADMLIYGSYKSWSNYNLWNAWVRLWAIGLHALESIFASHLMMGKYSKYELVEDYITSEYEPQGYKALIEAGYASISAYADGTIDADACAKQLWKLIEDYDFEVRLRPEPEFDGVEWAMRTPDVHDLFLGVPENHERWRKEQVDPWIPSDTPA
ncbi:NAD(P)/FAD-dependent oxidoreductase [Plesiocystis pacifica]|nr:tryptophan 7-halogenase [Plesiocystis pacifica]